MRDFGEDYKLENFTLMNFSFNTITPFFPLNFLFFYFFVSLCYQLCY